MGRIAIWGGPYAPAEPASYPDLVPLFGVQPLTPYSPCPHHGLLPDDTRLVCVVCHRTGARAQARIDRIARDERRTGINQPETEPAATAKKFRPKGRTAKN